MFFSGNDAGYLALQAAEEAVRFFKELYNGNRFLFRAVIEDIGVGVGIDFGEVRSLVLGHSLTVLGDPVVFACRLAGGPPHTIYVNQAARDRLVERSGPFVELEEGNLEIKSPGNILVYRMRITAKQEPEPPFWKPSGL